MSAVIFRAFTTKEDRDNIASELVIKFPKNSGKEPILMYSRDDETINVPKYWAKSNRLPICIKSYQVDEECDYQDEIIQSFSYLGQILDHQHQIVDETVHNIIRDGCSLISTYTGSGKSHMTCQVISKIGPIYPLYTNLIIINNKVLLGQWIVTILSSFNCDLMEIGTSGKLYQWFKHENGVKKKIIKNDTNITYPQIVVCMVRRIKYIPDQLLNTVNLMVVDEAQDLCSEMSIKLLLEISPLNLLFCTATPVRDDGSTKFIEVMCPKSNYVRLANPHEYNIKVVNTGVTLKNIRTISKKDWAELRNLLCSSEIRNKLILNIINRIGDQRSMILTDRIKHANLLNDLFHQNSIESSVIVDKVTKKNYVPKRVLICTTSKAGTGFDEKTFCDEQYEISNFNNMIITMSIKSHQKWIQYIGRMRGGGDIYYLLDKGKVFNNHFNDLIDAMNEYEMKYNISRV